MGSVDGYLDLYVEKSPLRFAGAPQRVDAAFSVIGVPFDSTSTYRPGQRFAPNTVREASLNIEGNAYLVKGNIDELSLGDLGDVAVIHGNASETLVRVSRVVSELASRGSKPVLIGGEHIISLGAVRGLAEAGLKPCVVVLDAHFDLRRDYMGERLSHATVTRLIVEEVKTKVFIIGVRAFEESELEYAESSDRVKYLASWNFDVLGVRGSVISAKSFLSDCRHIYLSIDMDFYDPAFAPGVSNPEPGGLSSREGLLLVSELAADSRVVGVDVVEVTPPYDSGGVTSILAAKTLQQAIVAMASAATRRRSD